MYRDNSREASSIIAAPDLQLTYNPLKQKSVFQIMLKESHALIQLNTSL